MWLVTTVLDSADIEHFHHHRKFIGQLSHRVLTLSTRSNLAH